MTKEEAIKFLELDKKDRGKCFISDAIDIAIKALEQQPCEDCVSRKAVDLLCFKYLKPNNDDNVAFYEHFCDLPPVTPAQSWIPVSERLPMKSSKYWCTFGGTNFIGIDYYTTESDAKKLFDDAEENVGWKSRNVIAWMPLPKPYEEKRGDKEW